jgi:hypothetical protein
VTIRAVLSLPIARVASLTDAETTALVELTRLSMTLVLIAASREVEAARGSDHRYAETGDLIAHLFEDRQGIADLLCEDVKF